MGWGELFNVIIRIMLAVFGYATQLEKIQPKHGRLGWQDRVDKLGGFVLLSNKAKDGLNDVLVSHGFVVAQSRGWHVMAVRIMMYQ